jgi:UDP-3-O-[3-hydroxymyristoyl] glucosamine N-acyltransferase
MTGPATTLAEIVAALGGELRGAGDAPISRIATLETAGADAISFLANPRYRARLRDTGASCVIVSPELGDEARQRGACIVTPDPYLYFARLTQWWAARQRPAREAGIHPSAVVDETACVAPTASIGAHAVVEAGAVVGDGAELMARAFVGRDAVVGADTRLGVGVVLGERCRIGARGIVHAGVVIGADGFGFAPSEGRWVKIEQLGAVVIGDDVEIGANTCIDRGALEDTVLGDGVKLDNLIQIGHNVRVGNHTAMAGCVGVAGSATIGAYCTIGGGAVVLGHLQLADRVHISAASVVMRSIGQPGTYSGVFPIDENAAWEKNAATLRHLHQLRARLMALERDRAAQPDDPAAP